MGRDIKCVVWDLDNTIWDGVLLENDDVTLKPGIIEIIQELDKRGILHSIASKNNFEQAISKLNEFGIAEYFLYPEINWNAKSSSIFAIHQNVNISLDTFLFIDDQVFERDEVNNKYQEVLCIDALEYKTLLSNPRLNPKFITRDSARRRQMYLEDIRRKKDEDDYKETPEKFLMTLNMEFIISEAKEEDLKRAEELTVRTNQLNATGQTYSFEELNEFRISDRHLLLICELTDKYGSYGKIGLALVEMMEEYWHLRLLLMSCRVMSRGVGTVLLSYIMQQAKKTGKKLRADFMKNDRNKMMYVTYKFANFKEITTFENGIVILENDLSQIQQFPGYIKVSVI